MLCRQTQSIVTSDFRCSQLGTLFAYEENIALLYVLCFFGIDRRQPILLASLGDTWGRRLANTFSAILYEG